MRKKINKKTSNVAKAATCLLCTFFLACVGSTGPSPTENSISGAVNSGELIGAVSSDIRVYLVEFQTTGMARVDSTAPNFAGEYSFTGFDFGIYGIEASTIWGFHPEYYGFRDGDRNGIFNSRDGVVFSSYGFVNNFNVPLYSDYPDTIRYESEPNGDAFLAQEFGVIHTRRIYGDIASGGYIPPDVYTGDLDMFRFQSVWNGYMTIELVWSSSADLDMFLYDAGGNNVLTSAATDGLGPERLYKSTYRNEEFLLMVASVDIASSYTLSIRIE